MNNEERIAVVDLPIPELDANEISVGQRLLAKAQSIHEDERNVLKALPTYVKAAEAGNLEAFRAICEIMEEESGSNIQDEMLQTLQGTVFPHKPMEKDLDFVRELSSSAIDDLPEDDLKKLLHVAKYYGILPSSVESTIEWIRNCDDAISDDGWMFPDGHDDGESID